MAFLYLLVLALDSCEDGSLTDASVLPLNQKPSNL